MSDSLRPTKTEGMHYCSTKWKLVSFLPCLTLIGYQSLLEGEICLFISHLFLFSHGGFDSPNYNFIFINLFIKSIKIYICYLTSTRNWNRDEKWVQFSHFLKCYWLQIHMVTTRRQYRSVRDLPRSAYDGGQRLAQNRQYYNIDVLKRVRLNNY